MTNELIVKRTILAQTAAGLAMGFGLEVKIAPAENGGIELATRAAGGAWYKHGLFGTDANAASAGCELAESIGLKWSK